MSDAAADLRIDAPYLLALNIPLVRTPDGRHFADPSWAKDLMLHTEYLTQLTLLCPHLVEAAPAGWHEVAAPGMRITGWRTSRRGWRQYWGVALMIAHLLREVPRARVVHTGVAGYPVPAGWAAVPLARLFGRKVAITVESAFWRLPHGAAGSAKARRKAAMWEAINRYCLRNADYAAYSQDAYRASLPSPRAGGGELFQASWIDDEVVLSADAVAARHAARAAGPARFLFASRMIAEKGTGVVAAALAALAAADAAVQVDILGEGPDMARLRDAAVASDWARAHVRLIDPVPYGPQFFALLGRYDAVLVPSLSDEQPRIIYDAYSQGVTAIGTDTAGIRACLTDGETGMLVPPGDAAALADAMRGAAGDLDRLAAMGARGRDLAAQNTHRGMHRHRARSLIRMLAGTP